jgi:hypothetical protein
MRPLYIKGHLDGTPINRMLVDGVACMNIMSWSLFRKLGHKEEEHDAEWVLRRGRRCEGVYL